MLALVLLALAPQATVSDKVAEISAAVDAGGKEINEYYCRSL